MFLSVGLSLEFVTRADVSAVLVLLAAGREKKGTFTTIIVDDFCFYFGCKKCDAKNPFLLQQQ